MREYRHVILGAMLPPGGTLRAMTHRLVAPNQWEPAGLETVVNHYDAHLAAGSRLLVAPNLDGSEWHVEIAPLDPDE